MPDPSTSTSTRNTQLVPFLAATFFLTVPLGALLLILRKPAPSTPAENYLRAVRAASQPNSSQVSRSLVSVSFSQQTTVVTWTRKERVSDYQGKAAPATKDTWVTVVPHLKRFCQEYVKAHGSDRERLSLRLQQRLGLPPDSKNDTFLELTVVPKDMSEFFRPCNDPSPATNSCQPPSALTPEQLTSDLSSSDSQKKQAVGNHYWFLNNYYSSFGSSWQYPWTTLGYTFDWAPDDDGKNFVRFGESEFVIPAKAPIQFVSAADTVAYCTPN